MYLNSFCQVFNSLVSNMKLNGDESSADVSRVILLLFYQSLDIY